MPCGMRCLGERAEAKGRAAAALSLYRSRDAEYAPAFALALAARYRASSQRSQRTSESATRKIRQSNSVTCRCCGRSQALNQGDPAKALDDDTSGCSVRPGCSGYSVLLGSFIGALVSGLRARHGLFREWAVMREAAAEFQKILDHPGIMLNDPMGPLARLQLARALSASGDREKSSRRLQGSAGSLERCRSRHSGRCRKPRQSPPDSHD